jgi:hypothetical protein
MKRILINDRLYPNKFSVWRNEEINYFLSQEDLEVDILVFKLNENAGITFDFDYEYFSELLKDYNIFIFDKSLNHINRYNSRFDGTQYNGRYRGSYLLTKKSKPLIEEYDAVYHIFLNSFHSFNKNYNFPLSKQFIHLYPGGGFNLENFNIDKEVNIISTHPLTTKVVNDNNNRYIECLMAPICKTTNSKNFDNKKLTVCFSSLGDSRQKGNEMYKTIEKLYKKFHKEDDVDFISISNKKIVDNNLTPMDYKSLLYVYKNWIDIYINTETGISFNGWPLGLEAASQGCILMTTDNLSSQKLYNIEEDTFIICNTEQEFVNKIHNLYMNRRLMNEISNRAKKYLDNFITVNNQQEKIIDFMKNNMSSSTSITLK